MLNAGVITSKENQGAGSQNRPLLLDLYCGAGGASRGYQNAGFRVIGNDIKEQPHYIGDDFIMMDALQLMARLLDGRSITGHGGQSYKLDDFRIIAASPPCQAYSRATAWRGSREDHPDLIDPTREALLAVGIPYIIENVQEARELLRRPLMLCGTHFGLPIRRHRYFEVPLLGLVLTPTCQHRDTDYAHDHGGKQTEAQYRDAMGCTWMTVHEAREAIPPAYTEWLGRRILAASCQDKEVSDGHHKRNE